MDIIIERNLLPQEHVEQLTEWVTNNQSLKDFSINDTTTDRTVRSAFSITYCNKTLPALLDFYLDERYNIYNIIGIVTTYGGDLPEHEDDDLVSHLRENRVPGVYIRMPEMTTVYYPQICSSMVGGDLIYESNTIKPETNMMVTFPSNQPHSVTSVESTINSRVCIVCEKYTLLPMIKKHITFGEYRPG